MAKLKSTNVYGDLTVTGKITKEGKEIDTIYLGANSKAADSFKLDGQSASYYAKDSEVVKLTSYQEINGKKIFIDPIEISNIQIGENGFYIGALNYDVLEYMENINTLYIQSNLSLSAYPTLPYDVVNKNYVDNKSQKINNVIDTSYNLTSNLNLGQTNIMKNDSPITVYIASSTFPDIPIGYEEHFIKYGTGDIIFRSAPVGTDATIRSANNKLTLKKQYAAVTVKKIDTNEWILIGALE